MNQPEMPPEPAVVDVRSAVIVHFYRALVGHMDVWRQRMDATTNWAAATTAAMVTFSFSSPNSPHFTLLLAAAFDVMFLMMESRRYQIFDVWRQRFRLLNRYIIAPELGVPSAEPAMRAEALRRVGIDLGRLVPNLSFIQAVGYRLRRNYGYVLILVLVAWILKLEVHPTPAADLAELVERASIGVLLPGSVVMITVSVAALAALGLALSAPTEQMVDWADLPSPLRRLVTRMPMRDE